MTLPRALEVEPTRRRPSNSGLGQREWRELVEIFALPNPDVETLQTALAETCAERDRLAALLNTPRTADFLESVQLETAHQIERWGAAHDRGKSAENWYWLVGFLSGKALRAVIEGDREKALHHTISSAAALANWHAAITAADPSSRGVGDDRDLEEIARFDTQQKGD